MQNNCLNDNPENFECRKILKTENKIRKIFLHVHSNTKNCDNINCLKFVLCIFHDLVRQLDIILCQCIDIQIKNYENETFELKSVIKFIQNDAHSKIQCDINGMKINFVNIDLENNRLKNLIR